MYNYNQFGIRIFKNEKHETAIHSDIELIYVVQGKAKVTVRDAQYVLGKGDLIVINSSIQHSVDCSGENIVCSIKYDYQVLVHILNLNYSRNSIRTDNGTMNLKIDPCSHNIIQ